MYEYRAAYRFPTGEVEGFKGIALGSAEAAKSDCLDQMRRKCVAIHTQPVTFDLACVIESEAGLTAAELEQVRSDWASNLRY